jgi:hypothetical protein
MRHRNNPVFSSSSFRNYNSVAVKNQLLLIFLLFSTSILFAQEHINQCIDSSKFVLTGDGYDYPELSIKIDDEWRSFPLFEEITDQFGCNCQLVQLNQIGSKELIIRYINSSYGSGGGSSSEGIQIWNLDSGIILLDELTACSEESFGKHGGASYHITSQKRIEIQNETIIINAQEFITEWNNADYNPTLSDECKLIQLEPGMYNFAGNKLERQ